ncbi:MAG: 30S ribosomal protein S1 [Candidatus Margulisbacteria bacterium]|nr:30S ribosomal protein S1 [Candidatus Margulisiibacteriota bacterium]
MAQELSGTNLEKGKGEDEFLEVENLIKETLAESKVLEKKEEAKVEKKVSILPTPPPPPEKEEPLKGTTISTPIEKATPAKTEASSYEATLKEYKVGDIVKGIVLKVDLSGVLVDIKYKADGLILPEELSDKQFSNASEIVKVGDVIDVYIENIESKAGHIVLSKKRADEEVQWRKAYDSFKKQTAIEGKVTQVLRGGLAVDCSGVRGFVPASQVKRQDGETLETFKDKTILVKILEINRRQSKIVMSHKMAAGEKNTEQQSKLLDELQVGQVRKGTVSSLKSFGAFVDLGGIEGLIHLSELSWKRVRHPSVVLKVGQETEVFVLGIDKVNKKIALGLKELQTDPWSEATDHYKPGQIVKAKILRFAKFGAFAELDHDLEGLIHISEMSRDKIANPEDAAKIGEIVDVKILRVLPEEQKIGLSIKGAIKQKEKQEIAETAPPPDESKVTIGDIIAQKEKERQEQEEEQEEVAENTQQEDNDVSKEA